MGVNGPPVESLAWDWWPSGSDGRSAGRHLLPVGKIPASRVRFDPALWEMEAVFPDRYPIGTTGSVPPAGDDRYVFFNPATENILLQLEADADRVLLMSSSVAFLASSIAIYSAWYSRFLAVKEGDPDLADTFVREAAKQLHAVERKDPHGYWPSAAADWAMQL